MTKLNPEEEEFWEDYYDAIIDEFVSAQSHYFSALRAQAVALEQFVGPDAVPVREPIAHLPTCRAPVETKEIASADREVYDARTRFERAIGLLQNMSVEECRRIIAQINVIQEKDLEGELYIRGMVRYLAAGKNAGHSRDVQKRTRWYQIVPSDGPGTSLKDL
ncbi:MAG: hypothetical protein IH872_13910 [Chloroflexi bacterium]|nr:hypothetical protein [Chloroflexota bacterium]